MVDMFTASLISQIYDKVNDANKKKMEKMTVVRLADAAYKIMKKNSVHEPVSPAQQLLSQSLRKRKVRNLRMNVRMRKTSNLT